MNNDQFQKTVHAKCILVGEHAVIRGHSGIVFPIKNKSLSLSYQVDHSLMADFDAPHGENLLIAFWKVIDACHKLLDRKHIEISGKFFIKNDIPMGTGMGFSSAICAAVTYWVLWKGWIQSNKVFDFARTLENIFHGKSSGIDIAGVITDDAIIFNKKTGIKKLNLGWKPHLYISPSNYTSSTSICIKHVEILWETDIDLAKAIDELMAKSACLAEEALTSNEKKGLSILAQAILDANSCFQQWGLIPQELQQHIDILQSAGAIAVKPTGSGAGGYVLSLWDKPPKDSLGIEMVSIF